MWVHCSNKSTKPFRETRRDFTVYYMSTKIQDTSEISIKNHLVENCISLILELAVNTHTTVINGN